MTADDFRRLALRLPGASESAHMNHPDFRVGGKIFATLAYPEDGWGMVKLKPVQQRQFIQAEPEVFAPVRGGWGRQGCTSVCLEAATTETVRRALVTAWRNIAPKDLLEDFEDE